MTKYTDNKKSRKNNEEPIACVYNGPDVMPPREPELEFKCVYAGPEYFRNRQREEEVFLPDDDNKTEDNDKKCPVCGAVMMEKDKFCRECGAKYPEK